MLAIKLSSCEWEKIQPYEWIKMRCSNPSEQYRDNEYSESDLDNFVEILFRDCAERLKVQYGEIRDILYGHNISFFEEKARYFSEYDYMQPNEREFESLTSKLCLPSAYCLEGQSNVQAFLGSFASLELKDKVEILERLSSAKLELGMLNVGPDNYVGQTIAALSEQSKCKLVKSVFDAEVIIDVELI